MRSIQLITAALAVVATSTLMGLGSTAQAAATGPTTTREKGVAIDCGGTWRGKHVYTQVYENSSYGNYLQVVIDDGEYAASREPEKSLVTGDRVRARLRLGGTPAVVKGLARPDGTRKHVHEILEDSGRIVESTGVQRGLDTDLAFHWRGHAVRLDCSDSFRYRLTVTRTPVE